MSLESAMEKLAQAYDKYTAVVERQIGLTERMLEQGVVLMQPAPATTNNATAAAAEPSAPTKAPEEKAKPGRKPKAKPEPEPEPETEEGDDFESEEESDDADDFEAEAPKSASISADQIREILMKVKDSKGADAARGILKNVGVSAIAQIPEKDYAKVVSAANKLGVKL
jgi:outer membrane biosynthesis protein TonB